MRTVPNYVSNGKNGLSDDMSQDVSQAAPSQYEGGGGESGGGGDFVAQCRSQAHQLHERKMEQERRMEALVEQSFGQIEHIFNALLQAAQANHASTHAQFEEATAQLEDNLMRHQQVETKLRGIMAILLGSSQQ